MVNPSRERSAADLVDEAINLARHHYPALVTVSAIAFLPSLVVVPLAAQLPVLLVKLVNFACAGFAEGCLLIGVAAVYRGNALPDAGSLLRGGGRVAGRVIRIHITRNIATYLLLLLLIIPGLMAFAYYLLATPAAVLEDLKVRAAITRGAALAKGEYVRILRIGGWSALFFIVVTMGTAATITALQGSEPMALLGATVMQVALMPMMSAIIALLYFDIRERREGVDIEWALANTEPAITVS